jgi:hypothetical protein
VGLALVGEVPLDPDDLATLDPPVAQAQIQVVVQVEQIAPVLLRRRIRTDRLAG